MPKAIFAQQVSTCPKQSSFNWPHKQFLHLYLAVILLHCVLAGAHGQGTAFSYQGKLSDGGNPANGTYDFQLSVHDGATDGNQVGSTLTFEDATVAAGLFTLYPDFGGAVFTGQPRWLQVAVRAGASTGSFTPLNPRQPVLTTPYAQRALIANSVPGGAIGSVQIANGSITADKLASGVAVGGAAPTGSILGAFAEDATGLLGSGYKQVPGLFTELGGWNKVLELSAAPNFMQFNAAWTGSEWFCLGQFNTFMDTTAFGYGDAMGYLPAKFNPSTGLWTKANTNDGPQFMTAGARPQLLASTADLFALGPVDTFAAPENAFGWRYNLASEMWTMIPTNGFGRLMPGTGSSGPSYVAAGSKLFALGQPEFFNEEDPILVGLYDPGTGSWTKLQTAPIANLSTFAPSMVAWTGSQVIVYSRNQINVEATVGQRLNPDTGTWVSMNTEGGPLLDTYIRTSPVWTGSELFVEGRTNGASPQPVFFLYNPVTDAWRQSNQTGTPQSSGIGISLLTTFWTGTEVGVVYVNNDVNPKTSVSLYNPVGDSWRTFTDATPVPVPDVTYNVSHRAAWSNGEALVLGRFKETASDAMGHLSNYRFTPLRTVYLFQKQSLPE